MQSASDLPPPPGALGADSLGLLLPDEVPGVRARLGEPPPPVANWLGKGSDIGDSGAAVDPPALGVLVAGTPAGGVSPAEGVDDNDVDGAPGVVGLEDTWGAVDKVVLGTETRGLGAAADERACANAASGNSSKRALAAKTGGLSFGIAITMALPAVPLAS